VAGNVEAFFFGDPATRLFGCHHPPTSGASEYGAVLCYPMGHEYVRTHRLYRFLARRLSDAGLHVLRFDYFGTGDSAGEFEEARLERWVGDTLAAQAELRRRFLVRHVYLAGLRLGAAVALQAAVRHGGLDGLVLWDPVTSGPEYLDDIIAHESQQLHASLSKDSGNSKSSRRPSEIVGFPMTEAMFGDLSDLDLFSVARVPASRTLLVDSSDEAIQEKLRAHVEGIGGAIRFEHIPHPKTWTQDPYKTVVPSKIIDTVGRWISERER
jgi:pimeloyl-ACP methyl ester carboxylesterase